MTGTGSCMLRIREALHALTPKERHLATYLLDNADQVINMSLDELSVASETSISTIVRLCKTLGYSGFKELCRSLYSDITSPTAEGDFEDITPGDEPEAVMTNICQCNIRAIENTLAILDKAAPRQAVERLCEASRIDFYGLGSSGLVAQDACSKFIRCGKRVCSYTDAHSQMLSAVTLKEGDVAVLISYSGETTDILNLARQIRTSGATIITLTRYGKNTLSELANIRLCSSSTETLFRIGPMSSRIAQLTVVDILYAAVCSRSFDEVKRYLELSRTASIRMHQNQTESR